MYFSRTIEFYNATSSTYAEQLLPIVPNILLLLVLPNGIQIVQRARYDLAARNHFRVGSVLSAEKNVFQIIIMFVQRYI